MQEHRTSSAAGARTALRAPSSRSTARGLGISDALAVALVPEQLPACLDEIATVEQVLGEAVPSADEREIEERRHELALLRAMRHQLVGLEHEPALVGPAALVSQIVAGAAADSVALLEQALEIESGATETSRDAIRRQAAIVASWMTSYVDALEVQWFAFDPD
jgi:hypothetical protein